MGCAILKSDNIHPCAKSTARAVTLPSAGNESYRETTVSGKKNAMIQNTAHTTAAVNIKRENGVVVSPPV